MKSVVQLEHGGWLAMPVEDEPTFRTLASRARTLAQLEQGEFRYLGPVTVLDSAAVPERAIRGLPMSDWPARERKRRLTIWYFLSLTVVAFVMHEFDLPAVADAAMIVGCSMVTVWLREKDII